MTGFFRIILFFILFLIVVKLFRLIARYWLSSKQNIDDLRKKHTKESKHFDDVEEADFREIPSENKKESDDN